MAAGAIGSLEQVIRPTGRCVARQVPIAPGEQFVAILLESDADGRLVRQDYSIAAWDAGARPAPDARVVATWRGTMPDPARRPVRTLIADQAVADLFDALSDQDTRPVEALRYLLALWLVRRRWLQLVHRSPEELVARWSGLSGRAAPDAEPFRIRAPRLDAASIQSLIEQLGALLADSADGAPDPITSTGPGRPAEPTT